MTFERQIRNVRQATSDPIWNVGGLRPSQRIDIAVISGRFLHV